MDLDALVNPFVELYYTILDTKPLEVENLYRNESMLTMDGHNIQGAQNIAAKLNSLPFDQCHREISSIDCQPFSSTGGVLVFVNGNLRLAAERNTAEQHEVSGEKQALKFSQMFHLIPTPQGSYYVLNDMFQLN